MGSYGSELGILWFFRLETSSGQWYHWKNGPIPRIPVEDKTGVDTRKKHFPLHLVLVDIASPGQPVSSNAVDHMDTKKRLGSDI